MANSIVITIDSKGKTTVDETGGSKYTLPEELQPFLNNLSDNFVEMRNAEGSVYVTYNVTDVEKVINIDEQATATEFIINDVTTLFNQLKSQ